MTNPSIKRNHRNTVPARKGSSRARLYSIMIVTGLVVISGFFFAAQQHFSSMDLGIKNSRLRRQVDDLEAEKRRLLVARETSLSPTAIRAAVKKLNLATAAPSAPGTADEIARASAPSATLTAAKVEGKGSAVMPATLSTVAKTVMTRPSSAIAAPRTEQVARKAPSGESERRRIASAE